MATNETVYVEERSVACDGNGALGHPRVYLNMGDENEIVCPYCSRHFVLKEDAKADAGH